MAETSFDAVAGSLNSNFVLLWTNPNPDASYPAQNITLDLSPYRFVLIISLDGSGIVQVGHRYVEIIGNGGTRHRDFWAYPTYIQVSEGSNPTHCTPTYIYGIK